jgi:thioesterase domain-containing protein
MPAPYNVDDARSISIESLATRYLEVVSAAGLRAPLVLGGWSLGGLIAYEMARQLSAAGGQIERVIMIDSYVSVGEAADSSASRVGEAASPHGSEEALGPTPEIARLLRDIHGISWQSMPREDVDRLTRVLAVNSAAWCRYRPAPYHGRVVSIRAVPAEGDPDESWRRVAASLDAVEVAADHYTIVRPPAVQQIVDALLSRADPRS